MDDVGADAGRSAREALGAVRREGREVVRYAGPLEKRRFADVLSREAAIPRDVIDFALFGDSRCGLLTGANRNGLLLDTVNQMVFSADDDTVARAAAAPTRKTSVAFSQEYEPREFWFFPDRASALAAVPSDDSDVLACHEEVLGRTLAEIGAPAGAEGRVTITLNGLVGDSGMGSPHYLLTLTGESSERFRASPKAYANALRSREMLRTVSQPTIANSAFCMTTFLGLDNRALLPPFFPVERNSDGVFGVVTQRTIPGSRVAFLPSVLLHAPPAARSFNGDEAWTEPDRIRMADIVIASILARRADVSESQEPGEKLGRLGAYLQELASLKPADFEAVVRSAQQMRNLTFIALLDARLREHPAGPAFWAGDMRKAIDWLERSSRHADYIVPRDLGRIQSVDEARRLAQNLVARYGELLAAWPAIVAAAGRLRARGIRVSEPV